MVGTLLIPMGAPAVANHENATLQVMPETQTHEADDLLFVVSLYAVLQNRPPISTPPSAINIDFELVFGPNDTDGNTPQSPDLTCDVAGVDDPGTRDRDESKECRVSYFAEAAGTDLWRVWIDHDKVQTTVEADLEEGRNAGPSDCIESDQPDTNNPDPRTDPSGACDGEATPGTTSPQSACPGAVDPEPDCTDVVSVTVIATTATRVDCDDSGPPDTERETNPSDAGAESTETYTCFVSDPFGNPRGGILVKGENDTGVNDPDSPDATSYGSPDYGCVTENDSTKPEFGSCTIDVPQVERETGTASICFYVESSSNPPDKLCPDEDGTTSNNGEPTGERQSADGSDTANDRSDRVEKTWVAPGDPERLDCDPETDVNPRGTVHVITCKATDASDLPVAEVVIDAEATGANDPDVIASDSPLNPDFTCATDANGECSFEHTGASNGTTTYRAWIDEDNDNRTVEADTNEGQDEVATPGRSEPDNTDVMTKQWVNPPATLTMTPESDRAAVGTCNAYTITVLDSDNQAVQGAVIDVEQIHDDTRDGVSNNEPDVGFCVPDEGPNAAGVDESKGDLAPPEEDPENDGTAGGETEKGTDADGRITIGINVTAKNGANGAGEVLITAFFDVDDDDDPEEGEVSDSSIKTWLAAQPGTPVVLTLTPEEAQTEVGGSNSFTATVTDGNGDPVAGATVSWTEDGQGELATTTTTTGPDGQTQATVTSSQPGNQTITATASDCAEGGQCSDSSTQHWGPAQCTIFGSPGSETLRGTNDDDVICGFGGKDTLIGRGGDDLLLGGGGNDILRGNQGRDTLRGGIGEDTLAGGADDDKVYAGGGDDILRGGGGSDLLRGGGGKDVLRGRWASDRLFGGNANDNLNGGPGRDLNNGGGGNDVCRSGGGNDRFRKCEITG